VTTEKDQMSRFRRNRLPSFGGAALVALALLAHAPAARAQATAAPGGPGRPSDPAQASALAAELRRSGRPGACATGEALDAYLELRERSAAARRAGERRALLGGPAVTALGGLLVIEDDGTLTDSNGGSVFDIDRSTLRFDPVPAQPGAFLAQRIPVEFEPDLGRLAASFGSSWGELAIALPVPFPFGNASYETVYATSDIGVFFQSQPPNSPGFQYSQADLLSSDEPRITPLLRDGPWIWADLIDLYLDYDDVLQVTTITWHERTTSPQSNPDLDRHFQLRLHASGRIEISYPVARAFNTFGAVQVVSPGPPGPTLEDVSTLSSDPTPVRHVRQAFTFPTLLPFAVESLLTAQFGFGDENLDALAIYQNFYTEITFYAGAYHTNGRAGADGIGRSGSKQTSLLHMNHIGLSWNLRDDGSRMSVLNHEFGHRWLYFVRGVGPSRNGAHPAQNSHLPAEHTWWSAGDASCMGGTRWTENGDGTFTSPAHRTYYSYSPVELYLMGFLPPELVPSWWYVGDQPALTAPYYPPVDGTFAGTRVDLSVGDIVAAEGPRMPAYPGTQREFRAAFVLLTRPENPPSAADLADVRHKMELWSAVWRQTVCGEASVETELAEILAVADPDCDFDGVADTDQVDVMLAPQSTTVSPGGRLAYEITVANRTAEPRPLDAWIDVILPDGRSYSGNPIVGPRSFTIAAGREVRRTLRIRVPRSVGPSGPYTVRASLGTFGGCVADAATFDFSVVP